MKLVILIGNCAVGKMTVGQELAKRTGLRLFHNHMMIEPVLEIFGQWRPDVTQRLRQVIFEEFAKSDSYGMIFTYMWAFDVREDWDYMDHVESIFKNCGAEVYYAELCADYDLRIERNKTENRLLNKPTKRNLEKSEHLFRTLEAKYRLNSLPGEIQKEHYIRIDNTHLSPAAAAQMIREAFQL